MNDRNLILEYLKMNEVDNINIINFIENYPVYHMERIGDSVFIKGISDRNWIYISSKFSEELEIIKSRLDNSDRCFAIIEDWMIPVLTNGSKIKWKLSTMKLVLTNQGILPRTTHIMSELKTGDSKFIYENSDYKEYVSIEYISQCISKGISSCVRIMDRPIAWGITQDDGAIGFLHVLPEFRRSGYGRAIIVDLINKVRSMGKIPFVHIEENNVKSMRLAKSLGFKEDKIVNWIEID